MVMYMTIAASKLREGDKFLFHSETPYFVVKVTEKEIIARQGEQICRLDLAEDREVHLIIENRE